MTYLILKAALSGIIIAIISEIARKYPGFGGLIASLPLISLLAFIWLWRDTGGDKAQVIALTRATLWYIVPSLPFFLILPGMMERGINFWLSLLVASLITICFYFIAIWIASRFGVTFQRGQ